MTEVREIYEYLQELAPLELQMDYDNSGFLVGRRDKAVRKVLLALDITNDVISEAEEKNVQLIVSHHPIIFHKLRTVNDDPSSVKVLRLAEKGIAAICMHTNLDIACGGVNDVLLQTLGAECEGTLDENGCGRVGVLPCTLSLDAFLDRCRRALHTNGIRYVDAGKTVQRLAVMGGSGSGALSDAVRKGCDTYVTADVSYHVFLDALDYGINLIDADHFCTENPIIPVLYRQLAARFPELEFCISEKHHAVISFY